MALGTAALGAVLLLVGVIGWVLDGDDAEAAVAAEPASSSAPTSTVSTTTSTTTSTTVAPTTQAPVTTVAGETVEEFAAAYTAALDAGDLGFLFDRLHPTVVTRFGEQACRDYVASEIALIRDYRVTGPVSGPTPRVFEGESVEVLEAPVTFRFRGEEFQTVGSFAVVDGQIRWFTSCDG